VGKTGDPCWVISDQWPIAYRPLIIYNFYFSFLICHFSFIPVPDWLNPIFVLRTQLWFSLLWHYRLLLSIVYLSLLCCFWAFFFTHGISEVDLAIFWKSAVFVEYFFVAILSCGLGVMPISQLPRRYVDDDLIHYTALSDKQVLFGYIYIGMFYSGVVCLCGMLFHLLLLPGLGIKGLIPLGYFFSFFLIAQMLNLFSASFFAGVRKQYEFLCMGFMMYVIIFILGGSFIQFGNFIIFYFNVPPASPFSYWQSVFLYVPAVSACAYGLILWNLKRKVFLPWKMFRTVCVYIILAGGLYLIHFLWRVVSSQ